MGLTFLCPIEAIVPPSRLSIPCNDFHFPREGIEKDDAKPFRRYRFSMPLILQMAKESVWNTARFANIHMRKQPTPIAFPPQNASSQVLRVYLQMLLLGR